MPLLHAIVLGVVQGITEFWPISSSGHLILFPNLLGWPAQSLSFDTTLHMGTLAALIIYFWRDWLVMLRSVVHDLTQHRTAWPRYAQPSRLFILILWGSVPAGVAGLLFNNYIEDNLRSPYLVAAMLIIVAGVMTYAERAKTASEEMESLNWRRSLLIGLAQALALVPGTSRSGITISIGMLSHLERTVATRFSFLLATPIILAAGLWEMRHLLGSSVMTDEWLSLAAGFGASMVVGIVAIGLLLRILQRYSLMPFVGYRLALGTALVVYFLGR
ncbi:MAG: undecaprenyl-diphosphatase UppP [Chloroflexi bacterium]|nr:undecaprenyl-diphosphatase UppP [Chloroflexota bacterium]